MGTPMLFPNLEEAHEELSKMRGWPHAEVVPVSEYDPYEPTGYVIRTRKGEMVTPTTWTQSEYLLDDGYVG